MSSSEYLDNNRSATAAASRQVQAENRDTHAAAREQRAKLDALAHRYYHRAGGGVGNGTTTSSPNGLLVDQHQQG